MKKVLVVGGGGFIGSHIVDLLLKKKVKVIVIDNLDKQVHKVYPSYLNDKAKYYFCNVGSSSLDYEKILDGVDSIFYAGCKVGPVQSMKDINQFISVNLGELGYFLEQLLKYGKSVKRIINSGSMAGYVSEVIKPFDENTKVTPKSYYGLTKETQENMFSLFAKTYDKEFVSLRYFSVYGTRQALYNPMAGPVPTWITLALKNKDLIINEDGQQTRDFINVKDIADLNYKFASMRLKNQVDIINCGTGVSTKILDIVTLIKSLVGSKSKIIINNRRFKGDLRHSLCDNTKLKNYVPNLHFVALNEGLKEEIKWIRKELGRYSDFH